MSAIVLWAPDDYSAAERAWRTGWGDLPYATCRPPVPAMVQLGVLSHAPWERLCDLVAAKSRRRARITWGPDVLAATRELLDRTSTSEGLVHAQVTRLRPLERDLLNEGTVEITRERLVDLLRTELS